MLFQKIQETQGISIANLENAQYSHKHLDAHWEHADKRTQMVGNAFWTEQPQPGLLPSSTVENEDHLKCMEMPDLEKSGAGICWEAQYASMWRKISRKPLKNNTIEAQP
jgi:hypothetical protein